MNPTHAILTYSKIHYLVTEEQAMAAAMLKKDEERSIDGNLIKGSNISDIVTIAKYYETFPNKRPDHYSYNLFQPQIEAPKEKKVDPATNIAGLRQMIKGVERYIASTEQNPIKNSEGKKSWYKGGVEPMNLLDKLKKQLEEKIKQTI